MRPFDGWPVSAAGLIGPQGAEWSNALPTSHGPLDVAGCDLQVAAREIDADAVAVNAIERLLRLDVAAAALERDDKLDLVVHVLGQRRIGRRAAVRHDGVGGLGEEERRFAHVVAHLLDVLDVIAADAPQPAYRKKFVGAGDRDRRLRRLRDDVVFSVGAHDCGCYWREERAGLSLTRHRVNLTFH